MLDASAYVLPVLVIGKRAHDIPHWMETVGLHTSLVHGLENVRDIRVI